MKESPRIVLQIGEREVEMSVAQAKKLYAMLHQMFGQQVIVRERVHGVRPNSWRADCYHSQTVPLPEYPSTVRTIWSGQL